MVMGDRGKTLVEALVSTSMGMSDSLSLSHRRWAGALSATWAGSWNGGMEPEPEAEVSVPGQELVAD